MTTDRNLRYPTCVALNQLYVAELSEIGWLVQVADHVLGSMCAPCVVLPW